LRIVFRFEQLLHELGIAPAGCNVQHRSNQEPNHVMKETIRGDEERDSAVAFDPFGAPNDASMIVGGGGGSLDGEGAKAIVADEQRGSFVEEMPLERLSPRKLAAHSERILGVFVCADHVPV
jgi:hypothetical protein